MHKCGWVYNQDGAFHISANLWALKGKIKTVASLFTAQQKGLEKKKSFFGLVPLKLRLKITNYHASKGLSFQVLLILDNGPGHSEHWVQHWRYQSDQLASSSVQFTCSVVLDSLRPYGLQYARLPCPSPTPRAYSNSCPLSWWCHPTISSSLIPFFSCLQSFPESGCFPMSQFFISGCQSIGVSALASVLPMNIQDWFILGLTDFILQSKKLSRVFSSTTVQKHQFCSDFGAPQNKVSHCFHFFPIYLPWRDGTRCHDLSFLNVEF